MQRLAPAAAAVIVLLLALTTAAAGDVVMVAPVYLNGMPEYALYGSAGLANIACDAACAAGGADIALLNGGLFRSSLPAGQVTFAELESVLDHDPDLVSTQITGSELLSTLNDLLVYGSEFFPQLSGARIEADRALTEDGRFCGQISAVEVAGTAIDPDALYSLVTTRELYADVCRLPRREQDLSLRLTDAVAAYGAAARPEELEAAAREERIVIVSETIDLPHAANQLMLRIPSPVVLDLSRPDMIPDTLVYALMGQDRYLCAVFPQAEIPYALCLGGAEIREPATVSTEVSVSRELPSGRKTANTFSSRTVFIDLRQNETIPAGSSVSVDLTDLYPAGMLLYLYYYDENGDIVPLQDDAVILDSGSVQVPAESGMTYVITDRMLNQSALQRPTAAQPWTAGVVMVFVLFGLWLLSIVLRHRRAQ